MDPMGQDAGNWKLEITRCRVNIHLGVLHKACFKKGRGFHRTWVPPHTATGPRRGSLRMETESSRLLSLWRGISEPNVFQLEIAPFRDDVATKKQSFVVDVPMFSSYKISNLHFLGIIQLHQSVAMFDSRRVIWLGGWEGLRTVPLALAVHTSYIIIYN